METILLILGAILYVTAFIFRIFVLENRKEMPYMLPIKK